MVRCDLREFVEFPRIHDSVGFDPNDGLLAALVVLNVIEERVDFGCIRLALCLRLRRILKQNVAPFDDVIRIVGSEFDQFLVLLCSFGQLVVADEVINQFDPEPFPRWGQLLSPLILPYRVMPGSTP